MLKSCNLMLSARSCAICIYMCVCVCGGGRVAQSVFVTYLIGTWSVVLLTLIVLMWRIG